MIGKGDRRVVVGFAAMLNPAQQRVIEQGEEALRLANARAEAGSGTQLDVLSSQTALTEARNTFSQALRDHTVAWARLERAMGDGVVLSRAK